VIIREEKGRFVIVRQHDHSRVSGEFACHWAAGFEPFGPTLYAITEHDLGWRELDDEVRFDPETGKPYSFTNYPLEPKLRAYRHGIDQVEAVESYAAYLCSLHYSSFVRDSQEPVAVRFSEREAARREKIQRSLPEGWMANADYNFRLLQLCDDLSLFVCLNEPGENTYPWYRDGFRFMGEKLIPHWRDRRTLALSPNPFSETFEVTVPYEVVEGDGRVAGDRSLEIEVIC
jgi:hypothetical protein